MKKGVTAEMRRVYEMCGGTVPYEAQGSESVGSKGSPRPAPELLPQIRRRFERALESAKNFKGMSAGSPKVMLEISDVDYLLKWLEKEAQGSESGESSESPRPAPEQGLSMDEVLMILNEHHHRFDGPTHWKWKRYSDDGGHYISGAALSDQPDAEFASDEDKVYEHVWMSDFEVIAIAEKYRREG